MIQTSQVNHCRDCGSAHIVRNGRNRCGSQQYLCRECGASKVLHPKQFHSEERKAEVLRAYQERSSSLRGLSRTFGISRKTITAWLKKTS
jgi:transposase-like protein|tara:strand:- start:134 stop:403 length:270 start_codon:yes stop_codon:yes gene_type:complete